MDYERTLAYLYAQLPMFHRIGKAAYRADLANTHALMDLLGHPERGVRCVHVAGTNGKGSTCHMLASVLHEAGYKTGLYTSPHLKDLRERIRINGVMIPKEVVVRFVEEHRAEVEPISPSFFEWTVGLALEWFRKEQVDIAVIEVGLGGRLDSTNVVTPEVSVITNIGWDHADLLGGSLVAIAKEKAGIIKAGIPVVVGEADNSIAAVFAGRALEVGTAITFVDQRTTQPFTLDLAGEHQQRNARTVLATIGILKDRGWKISIDQVALGLCKAAANTGLQGRWQVIDREPLTIADVGHNEDGLRVVGDQLAHTPHDQLHLVLGTVNDKDISRLLSKLPRQATYYFCKADIPRGLDAHALRDSAAIFGLKGEAYASVREAFTAARNSAGRDDLVLVCGSVFVVAEVL